MCINDLFNNNVIITVGSSRACAYIRVEIIPRVRVDLYPLDVRRQFVDGLYLKSPSQCSPVQYGRWAVLAVTCDLFALDHRQVSIET